MPSRLRTLMLLALVCGVFACGRGNEYAIVGSPRVDSVHGALQIEAAEGDLQLLTVVLDELPPPARLGEEYSVYVVWVTPPDGDPTRLGVLEYDAEARQGRLAATTPHTRFTYTVTAEGDAEPEAPSHLVVAEQRVPRTE